MNSAGEKLRPLCHSGPGWQRHTSTQRASNTLAPSSPVSSALQRRYCCSGSTLSRQCVASFVAPGIAGSSVMPRQLLLPFCCVHMLPQIKLVEKKKERTDTFFCPPSTPCFAFFIPPPPPSSSSSSISVYQVSADCACVLKGR